MEGERHLEGLRLILVPGKGPQGVLLFLDEGQMSAYGTCDSVSDEPVAVDGDQSPHQTVVAEGVCAAQGPLCARQDLVTHRALPCVLPAVLHV